MSDETLAADAIDDPSIPVLTERIFLPPVDFDTSIPEEPAPAANPPGSSAGAASVVDAPSEIGPSQPIEQEPRPAAIEAPDAPAALAIAEAALPGIPEAALLDAKQTAPAQQDAAGAAPATGQATEAANDAAADAAQAEALRAAVLQRVEEKLPDQVQTTIRELLQPSIDRAIAQLSDEAQVALRIALQDLVEQAVREEVARLRDSGGQS